MKRFWKFWLPALALTLFLSCVAAPLRAEKPSCLSFLPGAGSLPENMVIENMSDVENTFAGDQGSELADAQREYRYLYGGDLRANLESGKIIYLNVWLELYNSEGAPELATLREGANAGEDVPPEIRRRFPQVYFYEGNDGGVVGGNFGYGVKAIQGRFFLRVVVTHGQDTAEVRQKADSLGIWLLAEILKKLPGSPDANPYTAPAVTRESLTQRYMELKAQHQQILESRTQVVAYRDKVVKIYHYNVLKLTIAFLMENLRPPANVTDLVEEGIKSLLEQAGLTSTTQGSLSGVEIQRRLLKLVRSLDRLSGQYLEQAKAVRAEMAGIQAQLKKLPK